MEALPATELPAGADWQYEPKWDGFRCLAFRDHKRIDLLSKAGKPLTRYFPELVDALAALRTNQFVLDGEIVIPQEGALSFDNLLMRIHPAIGRIRKLSQSTPCLLLVFDLLVFGQSKDGKGEALAKMPLAVRRKKAPAVCSGVPEVKSDDTPLARDPRFSLGTQVVSCWNGIGWRRRQTPRLAVSIR